MAKFKVGDKVEIDKGPYRGKRGVISEVYDSAGTPTVVVKSDDGRTYHADEKNVETDAFTYPPSDRFFNAARSTNSIVAKAMNAAMVNATYYEFGKSRLKPSAVEDSLGKELKIGDKVTDWKGNSGVVVDLGLWAGSKTVVYKTPNGVMMRNGLWVTKGDRFVKANANLMVRNRTVMNFGFLDTVMRLIEEDNPAQRIAKVFKMRGGVKSAGGHKWKFPYPQMGTFGAAEYAVKKLGGSFKPLGKEDNINVAEITGPLHDALSANAARSRNAVVAKALNAKALNYSPYRKGAWLHDDKGNNYTVIEEEHWGKSGGAERFVTIRDEQTKQTREVAVTELDNRFNFGEATNAARARNAEDDWVERFEVGGVYHGPYMNKDWLAKVLSRTDSSIRVAIKSRRDKTWHGKDEQVTLRINKRQAEEDGTEVAKGYGWEFWANDFE